MSENGTIIKVGMNSTGFQAGTSEINRKIRVLDSSFKAVSQQAKAFGETTETLKQKQVALTGKIALQIGKVNQLREKYERSKTETGENSKATEKLAIAYNRSVEALNKMKGQLNNVTQELDKQKNELSETQQKIVDYGNSLGEVGSQMKTVGADMQKVGAVITGANVVMGKMAMDFEDSMAKVDTIADVSKEGLDDLSDGVVMLSNTFGESAEKIAEAEYQTISSNIKTSDSLKFVFDSSKLAKAGFTETTTAVDILTTTLNAYKLEANEATTISDQLVKAQKLGKFTIGELGDSLGNVIPIASQMDISTQSLFASIASLTRQGVQADKSITAVKGVLTSVLSPTAEASKRAKELGISFNTVHLKNVGLPKFLEEIQQRTKGNSEDMASLFGNVRALNGVMGLTGKASEDFVEILKELENSTGATDEAFEKVNSTSGAKFRQTLEQIKNSGAELGESLLPLLNAILNIITPIAIVLGKIPAPIVQIGAILGVVLLTVGTFLRTFGSVAMSINNITNLVSGGFNPAMLKTVGIVLLVVAALTALAAIIAVLTGKTADVERTARAISGMSSGGDHSNIRQPRIPRYAKGGVHSGGYAITDEEGGELKYYPDGTVIVPHDISMEMARNNNVNKQSNSNDKMDKLLEKFETMTKAVEDVNRTIKDKRRYDREMGVAY
ncbi:phage tail tape measure protein [Inediibacterium massiliense]|uniref:phage tail tape measure protein n=1 Tax=Inediibacterium massiliense TaxID=1658111 RepID=UPI0006B688C4|nr:phage tail tape measure protein [Inediibacterium massiliense]